MDILINKGTKTWKCPHCGMINDLTTSTCGHCEKVVDLPKEA